jgi:Zn-dependent peptidase ImmA (M78 family)
MADQIDLFGDKPSRLQLIARNFEPARLTQARVLAGFAKGELATKVAVSAAAIGQYEAAVTVPRADVLQRLADAVNVEPEFFASGRPLARVDSSQAHFRSLRSTRAFDRARALATAEQIWELVFALEKRIRFPDVVLPFLDTSGGPRAAAAALRRYWRLPTGPVQHFTAIAESHGLVVILRPVDYIERVDAFSMRVGERPVIITTPQRTENVFRHRFTLAHEIGHLVLHSEAFPGDHGQETEADEFAAEFLTPANQIVDLLPVAIHLPALDRLSRLWGVSVESLIKRMAELRGATDVSVRRAFQRLAAGSEFRTSEPIGAYRGEIPDLLMQAQSVAEEAGFTLLQLAAELRMRPSRVRDLLGFDEKRPVLRVVRDNGSPSSMRVDEAGS